MLSLLFCRYSQKGRAQGNDCVPARRARAGGEAYGVGEARREARIKLGQKQYNSSEVFVSYRSLLAKGLIGFVGVTAAAAFDDEVAEALQEIRSQFIGGRSYIGELPHLHQESELDYLVPSTTCSFSVSGGDQSTRGVSSPGVRRTLLR